jgi:hypothetical protein
MPKKQSKKQSKKQTHKVKDEIELSTEYVNSLSEYFKENKYFMFKRVFEDMSCDILIRHCIEDRDNQYAFSIEYEKDGYTIICKETYCLCLFSTSYTLTLPEVIDKLQKILYLKEYAFCKIENRIITKQHKELNLLTSKIFPMTEDDKCCVCYEYNVNMTKCKHNLCLPCLSKLLIKKGENKCPICRSCLCCGENEEECDD